jgi:hypothetical protein
MPDVDPAQVIKAFTQGDLEALVGLTEMLLWDRDAGARAMRAFDRQGIRGVQFSEIYWNVCDGRPERVVAMALEGEKVKGGVR